MLLDATTKTLEVVMEGAHTTTAPSFVTTAASFAQPTPTSFVPSEADGVFNGATAVTAAAAPASGDVKQIKELLMFNADTVQHTFTVRYNNNGTIRNIISQAIPPLGTLIYGDVGGFKIGAISSAAIDGATFTANTAAPTAPNSTAAFTMQGLGALITPKKSGKLLVIISGTILHSATTVNVGLIAQISHGTGSAPTSNAALTGTQDGNTMETRLDVAATTAANVHKPFTIQAIISGLTLGTQYWIDLAAKAITTISIASFSTVNVTIVEL